MWHQRFGPSCRNLDNLSKTKELLDAIFTRSLTAIPGLSQKSTQIVNKKIIGKGRTVKIVPPPSGIPSQSVVLPGTNRVRASSVVSEPSVPVTFPEYGIFTVYDVLYRGTSKTETGDCLGTRDQKSGKYVWMTYSKVVERMKNVGSAFINLGLPPSQQSLVGICTKNRSEFILAMLGCCNYSMVLVPLYETFNAESLSSIIAEGEMQLFICETAAIANSILKNVDNHPNLKYIVIIEPFNENLEEFVSSKVKILSFDALEDIGKRNIQPAKKPKPEDMFCICYTSGTTGDPKGVMVTHGNVLSCIAALDTIIGNAIPKSGTLISYLPCAHIYEIINEVFCLYHGGRMGFYSGDTSKLPDDLRALKPSVVPLVPKLMNAIYTGTKKKIMPYFFKRILYHYALQAKERDLKRGIVSNRTIWDKMIFSKVQDILGGQAELVLTASAPVSREVMKFFRCATGCIVYEAYGQSEVSAATMTLSCEHECGSVGPPLPSNHIKLVDVPDTPYKSADDVGEICIRGPNVFPGYFKNPKATKESIDSEGWHHTGDIGKWLPNGTLAIIDRKKHIFKLSQGEYISPEKTENVYLHSHILSQVFVDGISDQDFIIAVVVPSETPFLKWVNDNGFESTDFEDLCQQKEVRKALLIHLLNIGKKYDLNSLQQAGNIHLCTQPFTVENQLLTPTLKLKRVEARRRFETVFHELYREGSLRKECQLDV